MPEFRIETSPVVGPILSGALERFEFVVRSEYIDPALSDGHDGIRPFVLCMVSGDQSDFLAIAEFVIIGIRATLEHRPSLEPPEDDCVYGEEGYDSLSGGHGGYLQGGLSNDHLYYDGADELGIVRDRRLDDLEAKVDRILNQVESRVHGTGLDRFEDIGDMLLDD